MEVIEVCCIGKSRQRLCEDGWIVTDSYAAVIDGSTAKGTLRLGDKTTGRLAMETVKDAIVGLPEEAGMEEAAVRLTQAIADVYEANGIKEKVKSEPENRLTCSAVIWSNRRREIWMFGDCQCRVKDRTFTNPKKVDDVLAGIRSDVLRYLTNHGHSVEELQTKDMGREMIFDALRDQCAFQNAESDNPYIYTVLDGFHVDTQTVPVISAEKATEIVLATDGYPVLYNTLAETEACLRETLKNDPLCFNCHPATKGVMRGNESFDDRTYLRLAI